MKKNLAVISGLAVALAVSLVSVGADGVTDKELRVATQPGPIYSPIFVVKQKGWLEEDLKKDGVTVKWSSFTSGPPMNESFAAGQQDIGFVGDTPAIIGKSSGQDNRIFATAASGPKGFALAVIKDSPIKTVAELKGKKVAVTKGSYAHHLLVLLLQNAGLTVADIQLIHLTPPDLVAIFSKGDVDAAVTWEPFLSKLEDVGGKVIADGTGVKLGLLVIFSTQKYLDRNPEVAKKFIQAYKRGAEFIKEHPAEAATIIAAEIKLPPAQLLKLFEKFDYNPAITAADIDELKKSEEFLRGIKLTRNAVDIDSFVDTQYLKAAGIQ